MIFEQQNHKHFPEKMFFFKNFFPKFCFSQNSVPEFFFDFVQKSSLTKFFLIVAEINLTSRVHCIIVLFCLQLEDLCKTISKTKSLFIGLRSQTRANAWTDC